MGIAQELLHLSVSGQQELQVHIGNQASGPKCLENSSFITKIKGINPIWGQFKFSAHTEVCCVSVVLPGAWMSVSACPLQLQQGSWSVERTFIFGVHVLFMSLLCC